MYIYIHIYIHILVCCIHVLFSVFMYGFIYTDMYMLFVFVCVVHVYDICTYIYIMFSHLFC